jgi:succinyl-CoA synthetase beta subunit
MSYLSELVDGDVSLTPKSFSQAGNVAAQMLGNKLFTKQSAGKGLVVNKLYVTEHVDYNQEYYLAMTIDRTTYSPALIISKQGGMNIEEIAKSDPDSLHTFQLDYEQGPSADVVLGVARALDLDEEAREKMATLLHKLFNIFKEKDATLIEINPLVQTMSNEFLCLDAKFSFDDAAAKRQMDIFAMRDESDADAVESEAEKAGLVYVRLEGDIGNVVNGAGLAMATNDAISYYGGSSANFLDAGGQATTETMVKAFDIILRDSRVKVILVNIYGGKLVPKQEFVPIIELL